MVRVSQRLHPGITNLGTPTRRERDLRRHTGNALRKGREHRGLRPIDDGGVHRIRLARAELLSFCVAEGALPVAQIFHLAVLQISDKSLRALTDVKRVPFRIRARVLVARAIGLAIDEQRHAAVLRTHDRRVRLAIREVLRLARYHTEPADVIKQPAAAQTEHLRIRLPLLRAAPRKESAVSLGHEAHHGGEVAAQMQPLLIDHRRRRAGDHFAFGQRLAIHRRAE